MSKNDNINRPSEDSFRNYEDTSKPRAGITDVREKAIKDIHADENLSSEQRETALLEAANAEAVAAAAHDKREADKLFEENFKKNYKEGKAEQPEATAAQKREHDLREAKQLADAGR